MHMNVTRIVCNARKNLTMTREKGMAWWNGETDVVRFCLQGECGVWAGRGEGTSDWPPCRGRHLLRVLQDDTRVEICEQLYTVFSGAFSVFKAIVLLHLIRGLEIL